MQSLDAARRPGWIRWAALAALLAAVAWLWRSQLLGQATHFGNHDRLAYYLCNELFNFDSLASSGHFASWDDRIFAGVNQGDLPAIGTNLSPLKLAMPWVARSNLFTTAAYIQLLLTAAAAGAAYLALRIVARPLLAVTGALLYVWSVFAQLNLSQNDLASPLLVCLPMGTWILASRPGRPSWLLGMTACSLPVAYLGFAPQAEYIAGFWGLVALVRAGQERRAWPLVLCATALGTAYALSLPRLWAVFHALSGYQRDLVDTRGAIPFQRLQSFFNVTPRELWRALDEGIFGRYPQEAGLYNNNLNLNEGFQVYSSTFATLLALQTLLRHRGQWLGAFRWRSGLVAVSAWTLVGVVAILYFPPASYAIYLLFLRAPALHARVVLIALLPIAMLAIAGLEDWLCSLSASGPRKPSGAAAIMGLSLAAATVIALRCIDGPPRDRQQLNVSTGVTAGSLLSKAWILLLHPQMPLAPQDESAPHDGPGNLWLHAVAVDKIAACGLLYGLTLSALPFLRRHPVRIQAAVWWIGGAMAGQALSEADLRINGPQTHSFPCPFAHDAFFNAPPQTLRPPDEPAIARLHRRLDPEKWRVALITPAAGFFGYQETVVAQMWRLRTVEGYLSGVPWRLAKLPWPSGTIGFRTLTFAPDRPLPWPLLAALNVRYAISITPELYFNLPGTERISVIENPLVVTPRVFFCANTLPAHTLTREQTRTATMPPRPEVQSLVEGATEARTWPTSGAPTAQFADDRIEIRFSDAPQPRFLVLNEAFDPGWTAHTPDGAGLVIHPVNSVMRGIEVPTGITRLTLQFHPARNLGLVVASATVAAICLLVGCHRLGIARVAPDASGSADAIPSGRS